MFLLFIFFCAVMVILVVSTIHLDLGCTHTRESNPCLSRIDPQSLVHFTSVTALYRVHCGSFNRALSRLKRGSGVIHMYAETWNS